jgi:hypothetical protein
MPLPMVALMKRKTSTPMMMNHLRKGLRLFLAFGGLGGVELSPPHILFKSSK